MKPYIGWTIIVLFFAGLLGGFFFLKNSTSGAPFDIQLATTTSPDVATSSAAAGPLAPPPRVPDGYKEYRNEQFSFSVYYPADMVPREFTDHGPELTVVFQGGDGQPGFQIYAAPIEGTQISPERFNRDEPSGIRNDSTNTTVDGAQAVAFHGFDAKMGQTYEMWFIRGHWLYEVSTYKELEPWLSGIMQTWKFI